MSLQGTGKQGVQSTQGGFGADLHGVAELIGVVEGVTGISDPKQCGVVLIVFGSGAGDGGGADRSGCGADRLAAGGADWFCGCGKIPLLLAYGAVVGLVNVVTRNNLSGFQIGRALWCEDVKTGNICNETA